MTQNILISANCVFCNKKVEFYVDKDKYDKWQAGEMIQNIFPELLVWKRDFMISQVCEKCQEELK